MRDIFRAFYTPTEDEFKELWDNALIVLDTNALLNLYRYSEKTYKAYINLLTELQERLWMPYTVGREFHKNRYDSKHSQHKFYSEIIDVLNSFIEPFEKVLRNCRYHRFIDHDALLKGFKRRIKSQIKDVEKTKDDHKQILDNDGILGEVTNLYSGKVGSPLSEADYKKCCDEGKKRYDRKIPPGYKDQDAKRGNSQYGDYLIWEAMIDKASESKRDIIFVTDDGKEDWWLLNHGKTIGPRPELLEEFKKRSSQAIYFYKPDRFLEYASEMRNEPVDRDVTKEVSSVSEMLRDKIPSFVHGIVPQSLHSTSLAMQSEGEDLVRKSLLGKAETSSFRQYLDSIAKQNGTLSTNFTESQAFKDYMSDQHKIYNFLKKHSTSDDPQFFFEESIVSKLAEWLNREDDED